MMPNVSCTSFTFMMSRYCQHLQAHRLEGISTSMTEEEWADKVPFHLLANIVEVDGQNHMPHSPFREGLGTMYTSDEIPLLWKCWHCNYYTATID
jgi:hypothetical protein